MIGYLVRENVRRAGAQNHRFDGSKIDYADSASNSLASRIIKCPLEFLVCEALVQGSSQSKAIGAKTGTQQKKQRNLFVTGAKGGVWFSGAKELVYNRSKGFSLCLLCFLYQKQEQTLL